LFIFNLRDQLKSYFEMRKEGSGDITFMQINCDLVTSVSFEFLGNSN